MQHPVYSAWRALWGSWCQKNPHQLTFGLAFAVKPPAPAVAGTDQRVPQVDALPLLVYLIVPPIVKAGLWGEKKEVSHQRDPKTRLRAGERREERSLPSPRPPPRRPPAAEGRRPPVRNPPGTTPRGRNLLLATRPCPLALWYSRLPCAGLAWAWGTAGVCACLRLFPPRRCPAPPPAATPRQRASSASRHPFRHGILRARLGTARQQGLLAGSPADGAAAPPGRYIVLKAAPIGLGAAGGRPGVAATALHGRAQPTRQP